MFLKTFLKQMDFKAVHPHPLPPHPLHVHGVECFPDLLNFLDLSRKYILLLVNQTRPDQTGHTILAEFLFPCSGPF